MYRNNGKSSRECKSGSATRELPVTRFVQPVSLLVSCWCAAALRFAIAISGHPPHFLRTSTCTTLERAAVANGAHGAAERFHRMWNAVRPMALAVGGGIGIVARGYSCAALCRPAT
jgi:hypothetical protein